LNDKSIDAAVLNMEEEMIGLFHSINSLLPNNSNPVIQFVGSCSGEGVTTISREFAKVATQKFGKSVLLLDASEETGNNTKTNIAGSDATPDKELKDEAHTRSSTADRSDNYLDRIQENNLSSYHLYSKSLQGFHIGSFAEAGTSISIVFSSQYFKSYIRLLKEKFDLVIVDSPPLSESSTAIATTSKVDGVVLVVAAETTRWPVAERTRDRIEKTGGTVLGVVLNKQKYYIPQFIYRHIL